MIPVLVQAADGPVIVWFSEAEYAGLWRGVDAEAALLLDRPASELEGER